MSLVLIDTFTDVDATLLTAHAGEAGAWAATFVTVATNDATISGSKLVPGAAHSGSMALTAAEDAPTVATLIADIGGVATWLKLGITLDDPGTSPWQQYIFIPFQGYFTLFKIGGGGVQTNQQGPIIAGDTRWIASEANAVCLYRNQTTGEVRGILNGSSLVTFTDATPLAAGKPGVYLDPAGGALTSHTVDNFRLFDAASDMLRVGFIGDSITAGTGATHPPDVYFGRRWGTGSDGEPIRCVNQGGSGTTTADWLPSGSRYLTAVSAFSAAGVTTVCIMLGTNDCKTATRISAEAYKDNLQEICDALVLLGYTVILNTPPFIVSGALGAWDSAAALTYLPAYKVARQEIADADPTHVFIGDELAYDYFATNQTQLGDGVHPNDTGHRYLEETLWYNGVKAALLLADQSSETTEDDDFGGNVRIGYSDGSITIRKGDSYGTTSGQQVIVLRPVNHNWPASLSGWTLTFSASKIDKGDGTAPSTIGPITCRAINDTSIDVPLTALQTDLTLHTRPTNDVFGWQWDLQAASSSLRNTLMSGLMTVLPEINTA
jgi:lysophospholipase L1-like esterase